MSRAHGGVARTIDHPTASAVLYDAAVEGPGVSGAIIAHELSQRTLQVLVEKGGPGGDMTISGYDDCLSTVYSAVSKDGNAPYVNNPKAPMPRHADLGRPLLQKPRDHLKGSWRTTLVSTTGLLATPSHPLREKSR